MARHPDVSGEASEHSEAAPEAGLLLWILRCSQPPQVARAHNVQHAITVTNPLTTPLQNVKVTDLIQGTNHGCDGGADPTFVGGDG